MPAPRLRRVLIPGLVLAIVAGAGLTWALGGFEEAEGDDLPTYDVGDEIRTNQWDLTLVEAWAGVPPFDVIGEEGARYLAVEIDALNRTDESRFDVRDSVRLQVLDEPNGEAAPEVFLRRDNDYASTLHPGIEERVALLWPLDGDEPPDEVSLVINEKDFVEEPFVFAHADWFLFRGPVGQATLPVEDAPEPPPEGPDA